MAADKRKVLRTGFPQHLVPQIHPEDLEAAKRLRLYWYNVNKDRVDSQREDFMSMIFRFAIKGGAEELEANAETLNVHLLRERVGLMKAAFADSLPMEEIHARALEVEGLNESVLEAYLAEEAANTAK